MRKKLKIGDVFSVRTAKGLTYIQYTHENPKMGGVIRVLEGFFTEKLSHEELVRIVESQQRFITCFPIKHYSECPDIKLIGNFPIPSEGKDFPIFKLTSADPASDLSKASWWLWNGEEEWEVGTLSLQERIKYPTAAVFNDTGLIDAIETGEELPGVPIC